MLMRQRMLRQIEEKPVLKKVSPPVTKKVPYLQYFGKHPERPDEYRGDNIMESPKSSWDNYQWLRDDSRTNEEVICHIKAENAYCESEMSSLAPVTEALYTEMLKYLKESDEEVPYKSGDFEYFSKTVKGLAYTIHCRSAIGGDEVTILDENVLVDTLKCSYLDLGALEASPSHTLMAFAVDSSGYETYNIYIQPIPKDNNGPDVSSSSSSSSEELRSVHGIRGCLEVLTDCGGEVEW